MPEAPVHHEVLENGLTLLLRETHLAPVVSVQVWAAVGSADEQPGEEGLAHFHEHMLFKGTERRGVGEVAGEIEGAGGRINAYTTFDQTVYYATVPRDAAATALDVLIDAIRFSTFDEEEVFREREVVLEEIRRSEDTPGHVLSDMLFRAAFPGHGYGSPILGPAENVAAFDREKVTRFFRRWYAPDNLYVVAAGDFDSRELAAEVKRLIGDAEPAGARRARHSEAHPEALRVALARRSFEGERFDLSWPASSFSDRRATHQDLLSFLLGECESSRLVQRVKEKAGLVDRIDSGAFTPLDRGLFSIAFESDAERSREALEAIAYEVEKLRHERVRDEELERAKVNFLASEHFERESVSGQASKLGSFEVLGGGYRNEARYFETLRAAGVDDLLATAHDELAPEKLTVGALLSEDAEGHLDEDDIREALAEGVARARRRQKTTRRSAASAGKSPPASAEASSPSATPGARPGSAGLPEIVSFDLPNGLGLHVLPRREIPVVAARIAFHGGLLAERAETAGLTSFLASMWGRGTRTRTAAEYARAVEGLAADVNGFSGRSSLGVTFECTSEKLDPTLDLFAELLLEPGFAADELERERRETLAAIERRADRLAQRAYALFLETEFPTHPYRLQMAGERESVEAFDVDRVRGHYDRLVHARNGQMAVVGDVDPDAIARTLAERIGDLPASGPKFVPPPVDPIADTIREVALAKEREQSHLVIGFRGVSVDDPDRVALEVIAQLLAGQGGRLFLELRDKQSLAYSVNATNVEGAAPGFFSVYIGTAPDKVAQAKAGMLAELENLVQSAPPEAELARAKRYLIGNFAIDQQRNAAHAAHLALDALYGLGPDHARQTPALIEAVGPEDVLRVARRILRLDAYAQALVGPAA